MDNHQRKVQERVEWRHCGWRCQIKDSDAGDLFGGDDDPLGQVSTGIVLLTIVEIVLYDPIWPIMLLA
jgi:hypothetical protein